MPPVTPTATPRHPHARLDTLIALAVFALGAVLSVLLAGLAGDEEVARYLIARNAPGQPDLFLSLVGRPFVTTVLALPAQFGLVGARLASALAMALGAVAVARGARAVGGPAPLAVAAFFVVQPFVLAHLATAMTEPWTAPLVAWGILCFMQRRWVPFALLWGLLPLARFEMLLLLPLAIAVLVHARAWRALPLAFLPLMLWHISGAVQTGDPLYLLHLPRPREYPAREALHYVRSLGWILGWGLLVPTLLGLFSTLERLASPATTRGPAREANRLLGASALVLLGLLGVYTWLATFTPITFGNLRYLAFAAAPVAWLGAEGVRALAGPRRPLLWIVLGLCLAGSLTAWRSPLRGDYEIMAAFTPWPLVATLLWGAWALLPRRGVRTGTFLVLVLSLVALMGRGDTLHLRAKTEHRAVARAAALVDRSFVGRVPIINAHPLLALELGGNPYDDTVFPSSERRRVRDAAPGTLWFWESHYTGREGTGFNLLPLLSDWSIVSGVLAEDTTWAGAFLVRRGAPPPPGMVRAGLDSAGWINAALIAELGVASELKAVRRDDGNENRRRALVLRTEQLSRFGRGEDALRILDEAGPPRTAEDFGVRSIILQRLGRGEEAVDAARRAHELAPEETDYRFMLGQLLWRTGKHDEAAPHILGSVHAFEKSWDARFLAGEALREQSRWNEAKAHFLAAAALRAEDPQASMRAAECAWLAQDLPEAETRLRALVETYPAYVIGYYIYGNFLEATGRVDAARDVWEAGFERTGDPGLEARLRQSRGQ